jgi:hypothetical protein
MHHVDLSITKNAGYTGKRKALGVQDANRDQVFSRPD